jgi:hypothetical protein
MLMRASRIIRSYGSSLKYDCPPKTCIVSLIAVHRCSVANTLSIAVSSM